MLATMTLMRFSGAALVVVAAQTALAQQASTKPSFADLLGAGYDIKSVIYLPKDAFAPSPPNDHSTAMITLQKGSAVAVCEYNLINWDNLAKASIEGHDQCDTYPSFVH